MFGFSPILFQFQGSCRQLFVIIPLPAAATEQAQAEGEAQDTCKAWRIFCKIIFECSDTYISKRIICWMLLMWKLTLLRWSLILRKLQQYVLLLMVTRAALWGVFSSGKGRWLSPSVSVQPNVFLKSILAR